MCGPNPYVVAFRFANSSLGVASVKGCLPVLQDRQDTSRGRPENTPRRAQPQNGRLRLGVGMEYYGVFEGSIPPYTKR
eukprot:7128880-Pyramimonas_sp.AAC.1